MTLRRPQTQKLQKESILAVEKVVNEMNCEFRRHEPDNAGIDGEIDLVKAFTFEGKIIKTQIKAGISYITSENEDHIRIKVERKYVELWQSMNVPVIILFYHPNNRMIYWKSVKDYITCDPNILKKDTQNVIIPFDKHRDIFSTDVLESLRMVIDGQFEYKKILFTHDGKEEILSNWFPVIELPDKIYFAPTSYNDIYDITKKLVGYHAFIIKSKKLYTFSDLTYNDCALKRFCECGNFDFQVGVLNYKGIDQNWYMELLNRAVAINCFKYYMRLERDRYYFSERVLRDNLNSFVFKPLRNEAVSSRLKIYKSIIGKTIEYKHMAVKLSFIRIGQQWFFQIEPDWYFNYPNDPGKTRKDIGVRIIKEKAGLYNETYLYLLHAWKQFLSNSSDLITFPVDDTPGSQKITISTHNISFTSNFILFNDYSKPRERIHYDS